MKTEIIRLAKLANITRDSHKQWRRRGGVPHRHRLALLRLAAETGVRISPADLDWTPPKKRGRK